MRKYSFKLLIVSFLGVIASLFFASQVFAMTPTLTLINNGNSTLQLTVYGDANSAVIMSYFSTQQLMSNSTIGYTNISGYFSAQLNQSNYSISNGSQVTVTINGQQSNPVSWQGNGYNQYQNNNGTLSLSQTNATLTVGQSQTITINGNYNNYYNSNSYYVSNLYNNNGIVTATISGSTLTLYGQAQGSATITVCSNYNSYYTASNCANVYVTVTQSYYYPYNNYPNNNYNYQYYNNTTTTTSTAQVAAGRSTTITLYSDNSYQNNYLYGYNGNNNYGYGTYNNYVVTNSNPSIAQATVSGSTLTVYGISPGVSTLTICTSYNSSQCANVALTVTTPNYYNNYSYYPYGNNNSYYPYTYY